MHPIADHYLQNQFTKITYSIYNSPKALLDSISSPFARHRLPLSKSTNKLTLKSTPKH